MRPPTRRRPRIFPGIFLAITAAVLISAPIPAARAGATWIGQKAPEFSFEKYLNAPPGTPTTLEGFRGRAVVIEFFSINCPNCLAAMPHYNELARSMRDRPVTFIALTNEPESDVRAFMAGTPMSAYVANDPDWSMWRSYTVPGVPLAVVINPRGVVSAIVHPETITPELIEEVLAGRTPDAPLSDLVRDPNAPESSLNKFLPLMLVDIRPSPPGSPFAIWKHDEFRARGARLADLIGVLLNVPPHLLVSDDLLLDAKYDVVISPPEKNPALVDELLRSVIEQMARPRLRKETRPMQTYILGARPIDAMNLRKSSESTPRLTGGAGRITAVNVTIAQLIANLQQELGAPVADETGLTAGYDFTLEWTPGDRASLLDALRRQIGFDVRIERRPTEVYVVRRGE